MLRLALICFMIAMIAALFGFTGGVDDTTATAQIVFFITATIFVISLAIGNDSGSHPNI